MPVTKFDITEFVGDVFEQSAPVLRDDLVDIASARGARPAVLLVLRQLPDRPYRSLSDIWQELPDLPDSSDPWEDPR